ncbi:uncharacterized protein Triagg1_9239 [Trichoderma aggressivum f. europaeum]|uniref:Uncharacterized protein n=1 Tax=Trichoderma aggressivum f. europaeum TaxID=173218 RepID=A0AAE1LWM7_9HYPO|nr:hypothetical protein Triagg1_9239 [Trichoderma aggressivum f. europaeum]
MYCWPLTALFYTFAIHVSSAAAAKNQFQQWYPEYGFIFDRILNNSCSPQFELYTDGRANKTEWEQSSRWLGSGGTSALVVPLVNCLLENAPEYVKSDMAGASVLLGLTPSILIGFGSDVAERSALSVVGRRPFLALYLSVGAPAVSPLRLFEHRKLTDILGERRGRLEPKFFNLYIECIILIIECAIVFGAIANNVVLAHDLAARAVASFAPHLTYLPLLWIFLAAAPHIFAVIALSRLIVVKSTTHKMSLRRRFKTWFMPWMEPQAATLETFNETPLYLSLSSFVSILTNMHFIFGTLLFSSLLFISVRDSIHIVGRFLASVFVCRIVLMYELARLRHLYNSTDGYRLIT